MNEKPAADDATAAGDSEQANDVAHVGPPADAPDADNPEWTDADFARAWPATEALPPEVFAALVEAGQPRKPPPAVQPGDAHAGAPLPAPASGSAWIDPDDAPHSPERNAYLMHTPCMDYEHDPGKAAENLRKHGVSFDEAATCLLDDAAVVRPDPDAFDEERWVLIGMSSFARLMTVVCTMRGDTPRLISARRAIKKEERSYAG